MDIESLKFVSEKLCVSGITRASPGPKTLKECLDRMGLTEEVANLLIGELIVSPEATTYAKMFHDFLWKACAPTLAIIVGAIAIPRILNKIFSGLF